MKTYAAILSLCTLSLVATSARADQFTVLATASTYGVLATATITNSGPTVISGNLGLYAGSSVTGAPSVINGVAHVTDAQAQQAIADAQAAFTFLHTFAQTQDLSGTDLAGLTLGAGVYTFSEGAALNGDLTLDFANVSNTNIIFKIFSTLTTSGTSTMTVINQGTNNNVYFLVGSSATLTGSSVFVGDIIAGADISLGTGASSSCGSLIALDGAVTLLSNNIHNCSSTGSNVTPFAPSIDPGAGASAVPEPSSFIMLATGLAAGAATLRRKLASA